LEDRLTPAVYNVTTTADVVDANDGVLSLREATIAANASVGVADTINVPAGTYVLTLTGAAEDAAATGDLDISGDMAIQGASAADTIVDGNLTDRVFDIRAGTVTLANLTVRNGVDRGAYLVGTMVPQDGFGGGIRSQGTLTLSGCAVTGNQAVGADDPISPRAGDAYGGGIYQSGGGLTLTDSIVQNNMAQGGRLTASGFDVFAGAAVGGGVTVTSGALMVSRSLITGNQAIGGNAAGTVNGNITGGEALGGGIVVFNAAVHQIIASTIAGNRAVGGNGTGPVIGDGGNASGGGLWLSGSGTVSNCTVSGNQAVGGTGTTTGTSTKGQGGEARGGGVVAEGGLISNSTMTLNAATGGASNRTVGVGTGGGFNYRFGATTTTEAFRSTIVAGNTATTVSPDIVHPRASVATSQGNNLIGIGTGASDFIAGLNGDQVGSPFAPIDPLIGPLANNGGPTPTHAPLLTSPAINRGSNVAGVVTDQRGLGFPRVSGPAPDVGAVEVSYTLPWATVQPPIVSPGATQSRFTVTYRDDRGIAVGSLGTGDLRVIGPNGFSVVPDFVSVDMSSDGSPRTATYTFTPPGGNWDAADNGTYTVSAESGQVTNVIGNALPAGAISRFQVRVPIVVLNANDSGPDSLRAAFLAANTAPGPDAVVFDSVFFSTPRTITLTSGALSVTDSVTVTGPGAAFVTLNGNNRDRILSLSSATRDATFSGLMLTGGSAVGGSGGAIADAGLNLTVRDCTFTGNFAQSGGAIAAGALTVANCIFTNNSATRDGGAVWVTGSDNVILLSTSTFVGNTAATRGGAVSADGVGGRSGDFFTVDRCTFDSNSAGGGSGLPAGGGGLYVADRDTTIIGTTFSANLARTGQGGGAYIVYDQTVTIENCTASGNTAADPMGGAGGGLYIIGSTGSAARVWNSTIVGNRADGTNGGGGLFFLGTGPEVRSSIVTGNAASVAPEISSSGVLLTESAVGDPAGFTLATGSANNLPYGTDVRLGPLADNGGPTKTHALLTGSPAIDAGSNPGGLATDQRSYGFARTVGAGTDIGAFEFAVSGLPAATAGPLPDVTTRGGGYYDFTVTFRDDVAVNVASLGMGDVRVTGPRGFTALPAFLGVDLNSNGTPRTATYRLTPPGGTWDGYDVGVYTVDVVANEVTDTAGNFLPTLRLGEFTAQPPTGVASVLVNDGSPQRSRVTSLTVTFDGAVLPVSTIAGVFRLQRTDGTDVPFRAVETFVSVASYTVAVSVTLTFTGTGLESGSLPDGTYRLTILADTARGANGTPLDADGDGLPGGDLTLQFHRLFGDINGDKTVNLVDLTALRAAFGAISNNANYVAAFDFNGDGAINLTDLTQFRNRFGVILP
jgi:hypothetical protein